MSGLPSMPRYPAFFDTEHSNILEFQDAPVLEIISLFTLEHLQKI
jgi:hypothetical protein